MGTVTVAPQLAEMGIIGLGVMGENLALHVEDHCYGVALRTHTESKVQAFIERSGASANGGPARGRWRSSPARPAARGPGRT